MIFTTSPQASTQSQLDKGALRVLLTRMPEAPRESFVMALAKAVTVGCSVGGYKVSWFILHKTLSSSISIASHLSVDHQPTFTHSKHPSTIKAKMKSFFSALALPALFLGALAAPATEPANSVEKRQLSNAYDIVSSLYADIQQYTGAISMSPLSSHFQYQPLTTSTDTTAASLSSDSSAVDNATAAAAYISNVESITAAVNAAQAQVAQLSPAAKLMARQTDTALAALVENLLLEVSGALNNIIATLGLSKLPHKLVLTLVLTNLLISVAAWFSYTSRWFIVRPAAQLGSCRRQLTCCR